MEAKKLMEEIKTFMAEHADDAPEIRERATSAWHQRMQPQIEAVQRDVTGALDIPLVSEISIPENATPAREERMVQMAELRNEQRRFLNALRAASPQQQAEVIQRRHKREPAPLTSLMNLAKTTAESPKRVTGPLPPLRLPAGISLDLRTRLTEREAQMQQYLNAEDGLKALPAEQQAAARHSLGSNIGWFGQGFTPRRKTRSSDVTHSITPMNNRLNSATLAILSALVLLPLSNAKGQNFINLNVTSQITGGSADTGSFFWNNTGRFFLADPSYTRTLNWNPVTGSLQVSAMENDSGYYSSSNGIGSASFGEAIADGDYSIAAGGSQATGAMAAAFGSSFATAYAAFAGNQGVATGSLAAAFNMAGASVEESFAVNYGHASGAGSFAAGESKAGAYQSFTIGRFNVGSGDAHMWISTDPVFEIGNGDSPSAQNGWHAIRSNALTVYKNGDMKVKGVIRTTAPAGDIPMFQATP